MSQMWSMGRLPFTAGEPEQTTERIIGPTDGVSGHPIMWVGTISFWFICPAGRNEERMVLARPMAAACPSDALVFELL